MNKENPISPPKLAQKILLTFLRQDLVEEVLGDLEEKFYLALKSKSLHQAKLNYWYQVLNYCRPFAIKKSNYVSFTSFAMFQNYYTIAFRNLSRQRLYSIINIGGLCIGLACFLIMMLYVRHEFSYNTSYPNAEHVYRVYQQQEGNVFLGSDKFAVTPAGLATAMREEFPEVKHATSVDESAGLITLGNNNWLEKGLAADEEFFKVFKIRFILGDVKTALNGKKNIVLTKTLAQKMFGDKDPLGQTFRYQEEDGYVVTGVIEDAPLNSSIQYSFIVNILYNPYWLEQFQRPHWNSNSYYTFIELIENSTPEMVESKFPGLLRKHSSDEGAAEKNVYHITSLPDLYFQHDVNFDLGIKGNKKAVYLFLAIAVVVLLLACVNYMNLAIARSIKRSREVGLRKVVGAVRRQLVVQFLGESILIALISLVLAIGLVHLVLPYFGQIMERPIEINLFSTPLLVPALLGLVFIVGSLSGSYPALLMSSLKPVEVLKAKANFKISGFSLQHVLIVVQFAASITLIIGSIVIYRQLNYIQQKELGFDKENIITIQIKDNLLRDKFQTLSTQWLENPRIISATKSSNLPTHITSTNLVTKTQGEKDGLIIYQLVADASFLDVFSIPLAAGRNFSDDIKGDLGKSYLINETAVKSLGWTPEEAVGKVIYQDGPRTIVGVMKDFHMHSMHLPIQPLLIEVAEHRGNYISIKVRPENINQTIAFVQKSIKNISAYPFSYEFLDENYLKLYNAEIKLGEIFGFFTVVAVLIAALGLFGLAAFLSDQRTKEVGIRKVLGASVPSLMFLLSKQFLGLVLIAFIIAAPLGWLIMNRWLQDFAYKVDLEWWMFAFAGTLALLIAKLCIGYQSLKASMVNPVQTLRSE